MFVRGMGAADIGKYRITLLGDPVSDDGSDPLTGAVMGVGVGVSRNAPFGNRPSMFGTPARLFMPPTTAIVTSDDPIPVVPPASTGGTPPAINSGALATPPVVPALPGSGFSFSSIPLWGWALVGGGLLFAFGGGRGR